ncbi:hypothetical protein A2634_04655 [Candidatus Amesbacteria bacterium RIFCSPHIGHO2_01_FULL_48_32]|uniref:4-alpha-glucanotransferase n=1 Tax=Candidatus Amesbacteria bacterium RIFCSPLOWO2_01_FULL_48_25 TaxID=1797259 RepID=A0A1F4ZCD2_9BACT|nr:MAG: hypothetical protein A2634_04655 [Candidatus Amesbacteria bacterium RIFCSPHIGHO2_01_FULL_48_32]OGD03828.1 MAG: hypothetical protein A2989_04125 [Candidatus Amesbacteria bacterium RIFCSPLOWO2_01_FULL_48_25]
MLGWELPPHNSGGLGTACLGLSRALTRQGQQILFVLPHKLPVSDTPFPVLFADDQTLSDTPLSPYLIASSGGGFASLIAQVLAYAQNAKTLAKKLQFDLIHAHDWLCIPAGLAIKDATGKPLIIHVHATEFDRTGGDNINPAVFHIEREGFNKADLVITVSSRTKDILVSKYGITPDKIKVVHNGIDAGDYPKVAGPITFLHSVKAAGFKIVLFVGRLTLQKGPDYFIKAAHKVLQHFNRVYFVLAGSGEMEHQVIDLVAKLGISDHVLFPGFLRGEQLTQLYKSADLFILPSVSEPFGLVPLESVINGTPVLISKQSGVSEVLSHALKVDFWDTDEMANQILAVLNYSSLPQTLITESSQEVQKLSWSSAADKVTNVYNQL